MWSYLFSFLIYSLVHVLLDEILGSAIHRCVDPTLMETSVSVQYFVFGKNKCPYLSCFTMFCDFKVLKCLSNGLFGHSGIVPIRSIFSKKKKRNFPMLWSCLFAYLCKVINFLKFWILCISKNIVKIFYQIILHFSVKFVLWIENLILLFEVFVSMMSNCITLKSFHDINHAFLFYRLWWLFVSAAEV